MEPDPAYLSGGARAAGAEGGLAERVVKTSPTSLEAAAALAGPGEASRHGPRVLGDGEPGTAPRRRSHPWEISAKRGGQNRRLRRQLRAA